MKNIQKLAEEFIKESIHFEDPEEHDNVSHSIRRFARHLEDKMREDMGDGVRMLEKSRLTEHLKPVEGEEVITKEDERRFYEKAHGTGDTSKLPEFSKTDSHNNKGEEKEEILEIIDREMKSHTGLECARGHCKDALQSLKEKLK